MKRNYLLQTSLSLIIIVGLLFVACNKGVEKISAKVPVIGDLSVIAGSLTKNSVSLKAIIVSNGGADIENAGLCWATTENPTIEITTKKDQSVATVESYVTDITDLTSSTVYYARAYAHNIEGITYSRQFIFTTLEEGIATSLMRNAGSRLLIGGTPEAPRGVSTKTDSIVDVEYNAVQIPLYPVAWNSWINKDTHNIEGVKTWTNWAKSADKNRTTVGHFLVSHNAYYPAWFTNPAIPWTVDELEAMLENRIKSVVEPLKDAVDIWTVVNEATTTSPGKGIYRTCVWSSLGTEPQISGLQFDPGVISPDIPVYIRKSFELARKYAPTATLTLCDAGFELSLETDLRSRAFQQLVVHLINKGTPINAVSLQCHITQGAAGFADPEGVMRWDLLQINIKKYKDLGLKVYLNEVDIGLSNKTLVVMTAEQLSLQKRAYKKFVQVALNCNVDGIFFWGLGEGHDTSFRPFDCAQLYDFNHNRKPAYFGVLEALQ